MYIVVSPTAVTVRGSQTQTSRDRMGVFPGAMTLGLEKITKWNLSTPQGVHQLSVRTHLLHACTCKQHVK